MSELFAEILKQWELVQQDRATCQQYLERTGPGESPYTRGQQEAWNMREHCLSRTLLASMPEIAPLLTTSDATGKVLLTQDQWEETQRDKAMLDWLRREFNVVRAVSQHYMGKPVRSFEWIRTAPEEIESLRQAIYRAMSTDTKGTSA